MTELSTEPGWTLASKVINTIDARGVCNTGVTFAVVYIHCGTIKVCKTRHTVAAVCSV